MKGFEDRVLQGVETGSFSYFCSLERDEFSFRDMEDTVSNQGFTRG